MKRFYALLVALIAALAALTAYYRSEPDTFYGIADAKEIVVSSESPVEVRRVLVVQGQSVSEGDTLLELHNPELDLRISQITHELSELRARKAAHATLTKSELRQLKAEQEVRVNEIRAEIKELEAQYEMNRALVSELRSLDGDKAGTGAAAGPDAGNPIHAKLESLRKLLELAQDPSRVYESRLTDALSSDGDPLTEQVARLEDELRILSEDRKRLIITARIAGIIGSVDFKPGEKASPFTPILTLHAAAPSFVRGYIHEDVHSQVGLRQAVAVRGGQGHAVEGEVVGVGARIVEYPERLRKRADILIWGREIVIRLPPENRFLLGEKVLIALPGKKGFPGARKPAEDVGSAPPRAERPPVAAAGLAPAGPGSGPGPAAAAAELPVPEASGLVYLPDLARYLVASDDTPRKRAEVYLVDTALAGSEAVAVAGLERMDDMEAVAEGGDGSLYILSSQSRTKGGKLPETRKLLVKVRREGRSLRLSGKTALLDRLREAAEADTGATWSAFLRKGLAGNGIDIEGMAVKGGDLLLGFKEPLVDGRAAILRVAGLDSLLAGRALKPGDVALWKTLELRNERKSLALSIAELLWVGDDLYLLSTSPRGESGAGSLWRLRAGSERPERLQDFAEGQPEGLVLRGGSLYVAFDLGSDKPSSLRKVPLAP